MVKVSLFHETLGEEGETSIYAGAQKSDQVAAKLKMVREKHCVYKNFTKSVVEGQNNKSVVKTKCNHCNWENVLNTTRIITHIKDCLKCSKEMKEKVSVEKHDAKEEKIENVENDEQILENIKHVSFTFLF